MCTALTLPVVIASSNWVMWQDERIFFLSMGWTKWKLKPSFWVWLGTVMVHDNIESLLNTRRLTKSYYSCWSKRHKRVWTFSLLRTTWCHIYNQILSVFFLSTRWLTTALSSLDWLLHNWSKELTHIFVNFSENPMNP